MDDDPFRMLMRALRLLAALLGGLAAAACQGSTPPLADCIATLRRDVADGPHDGVRAETFERWTRSAQDLRPTIDTLSKAQPEFVLPIWDYVIRRADPERVADGRAVLDAQAEPLAAIEARHGVERAAVVAVFGVETDYGHVTLRYPVIDAALSRACLKLDSADRRRQFWSALWLVQEGLVDGDDFKGSWAGAFGMTQFMPATFRRYLDAADGSGKPDIVHSVPDALATTANYLQALGWVHGLPWGIEVRAPAPLVAAAQAPEADHACTSAGAAGGKCRTLDAWKAAGVTAADGQPLALTTAAWPAQGAQSVAALFAPAGADGPQWLVTANYHALWQYNHADAYALAIGLLADQLGGAPGPHTPWPTDDPGLTRAELRQLQTLLHDRGRCEVLADGREGALTTQAIRQTEAELGLAVTGHAGQRLLRHLANEPARDAPPAAACNAPSP